MIKLLFRAEVRHLAGLFILGALVFEPPPPGDVPLERWVIFLTAAALISPEILEPVVRSYRLLRGLPDPTPPRVEPSPETEGDERGP